MKKGQGRSPREPDTEFDCEMPSQNEHLGAQPPPYTPVATDSSSAPSPFIAPHLAAPLTTPSAPPASSSQPGPSSSNLYPALPYPEPQQTPYPQHPYQQQQQQQHYKYQQDACCRGPPQQAGYYGGNPGVGAGGRQPLQSQQTHSGPSTPLILMQPPGRIEDLGKKPGIVICQHCRYLVVTETSHQVGSCTFLGVLGLLLAGVTSCGCCLLPLCLQSCKDIVHSCPNCHEDIGLYSRIKERTFPVRG